MRRSPRVRTTVVVVAAAFSLGLATGMPLWTTGGSEGLLEILGRSFTENRLMTLFVLTLPVVGLCERYGLQAQASRWVAGLRRLSPARVLILYQWFRVLHGLLGLRLNGHPTFVRPLVAPMAIAACGRETSPEEEDSLKAASAASENYGNFYGQNLSPVQAGVLLVFGVLADLGYNPSLWRLVAFSVPVVLLSVLFGALQFLIYEKRLGRNRL
ncbi:MAG: DUF969 family protein [Armatimonadetes bacterium]|nr:DUF969 family protein [Armatimonadota bacterium]